MYLPELAALARMRGVDASFITIGLYQGGAPPFGRALAEYGIDVLVLCAEEYQPPDDHFPDVHVLRCGFDDELQVRPRVWQAAKNTVQTAGSLRRGKAANVLVTCALGWNRSSLLTAMLLCEWDWCSGPEAVAIIRRARPKAFGTTPFGERLSAPGRRGWRSSRIRRRIAP